VNNKGTGWW